MYDDLPLKILPLNAHTTVTGEEVCNTVRLVTLLLSAALLISCAAPQPRPEREEADKRPPSPPMLDREEPDIEPAHLVHAFIEAIRTDDPAATWELIGKEAQKEVGPTEEDFVNGHYPALRRQWAGWKHYRILVEESYGGTAIVAQARGSGKAVEVASLALRNEAHEWRIDLLGPLVELDTKTLDPWAEMSYQVRSTVSAVYDIWTFVDGELADRRSGAGRSGVRVRVDPPDLEWEPGEHVAAILAVDGRGRVGTGAWTFHVKRLR